jgi:hypothetical protein
MPDAVLLTLAEAASVLDPPLSERQLRAIVRELRWQPAGWRHAGTGRGHPVACYDWAQLSRLHTALLPWLSADDRPRVPAGS